MRRMISYSVGYMSKHAQKPDTYASEEIRVNSTCHQIESRRREFERPSGQ